MDVSKECKGQKEEAVRDAMIEDHCCCVLCGNELKFQHRVDYTRLIVREDAQCPACQIRLKGKDHVLH